MNKTRNSEENNNFNILNRRQLIENSASLINFSLKTTKIKEPFCFKSKKTSLNKGIYKLHGLTNQVTIISVNSTQMGLANLSTTHCVS